MMSEPQNIFATGQQVEDYLIGDLLYTGTYTQTWQAIQVSVQRKVVICNLKSFLLGDEFIRTNFFSDIRAKASVEHPLVGSVLEAVNRDEFCFYARESLAGESSEVLHERGVSLSPLSVVRILRGLSDVYRYYERKGVALLPLTGNDLFIDQQNHCRVTNMAIAGDADPSVPVKDMQFIGALFHDFLEPNQPGSTRTGSLLAYMEDVTREIPLTWTQVHDLSDEVERHLVEPKKEVVIQSSTMRMKPLSRYSMGMKAVLGLIVFAMVLGLGYYLKNEKKSRKEIELVDMIYVPPGKYKGPSGMEIKSKGFWIDAHEVTIGEYAEFLSALKMLSEDQRKVYNHEEQPAQKISHEPNDWENLYASAKKEGEWNGLPVTLNYPVVGVDWWDAYAYSNWKDRKLPSEKEWYIAGGAGGDITKLKGTGWKAVNEANKTSLGIYGLAGNVSEWTRDSEINLLDMNQTKSRFIIMGASYLNLQYGARAKERAPDRNVRRKNLGFRTMSLTKESD